MSVVDRFDWSDRSPVCGGMQPMSRERPASPAWARYYRVHSDVLASWAESNGREPNCPCTGCNPGTVACPGGGERWTTSEGGYMPRCPECGVVWNRLSATPPARRRSGEFLGHVPSHRVTEPATRLPAAELPMLDGGSDVIRDLGDWQE